MWWSGFQPDADTFSLISSHFLSSVCLKENGIPEGDESGMFTHLDDLRDQLRDMVLMPEQTIIISGSQVSSGEQSV